MKISINREKIKEVIKLAILRKLAQKTGQINHTNRDGYYSPSRWWYDRNDTSMGGSILNTSGSWDVQEGANGNIQVTVNLDYSLTPR